MIFETVSYAIMEKIGHQYKEGHVSPIMRF